MACNHGQGCRVGMDISNRYSNGIRHRHANNYSSTYDVTEFVLVKLSVRMEWGGGSKIFLWDVEEVNFAIVSGLGFRF